MADDAMDIDGPSYLLPAQPVFDEPVASPVTPPLPPILSHRTQTPGHSILKPEPTKGIIKLQPCSPRVRKQWPEGWLPKPRRGVTLALPSSAGKKRPYDAFATDIAQTNLNPGWLKAEAQILALTPEAPQPPRRMGGMLTSLYQSSRGIVTSIASLWDYVAGQHQADIVAVATTPAGNKRRAIAADMSPSTLTKKLPGAFPDVKQTTPVPEPVSQNTTIHKPAQESTEQEPPQHALAPQEPAAQEAASEELAPQEPAAQLGTPPDSRPTSSQENKKHDSPMAEQTMGPRTLSREKAKPPREYTLEELANWTVLPSHIRTQRDYDAWMAPLKAAEAAKEAEEEKKRAQLKAEIEQIEAEKKIKELEWKGQKWARSVKYRAAKAAREKEIDTPNDTEESPEPAPKKARKPVHLYPPHVEAHWKEGAKRDREQAKLEPGSKAWKWYESMKKENPTARFKKMARKDAEDDELIARAKRATMLSPEDKKWREKFRRCRMLNEYDRARLVYDTDSKERIDQKVKQVVYDEKVRLADIRLSKELKYEEELRRKRERAEAEAAKKAAEREAEAAKLKAQQEAIEREIQEEQARQEQKLQEEAAASYAAREEEKRQWLKQQKLIRPLDDKWQQALDQKMQGRSREHVLTKTVEGTDITRKDLGTLLPQEGTEDDPSGWLNDEIVNGIIGAIVTRKLEQTDYKKSADTVPAYQSYSSAWYTNYQKRGGMQNIATWSRRKHIKGEKLLKCEKIFFPINTGAHWTLLIISPKDRTIEYLDSLNPRGGPKWFKIAREWLEMELGSKYDPSEWKELASHSARQQNMNDCGVFTCFNALAAAKSRDFAEVGEGTMKDARLMLGAILLNNGFSGDYEL